VTAERGTGLPGVEGQLPLQALQRFLQPRPQVAPGERCEMCTEAIGEEHSHVVDLTSRNLVCTCRACYLLFTHEGAAGGKYRTVPDRYRYLPRFTMTSAQWDELQIPVGMAFFFRNSDLDRFVAFYPSPGGATESLLPLEVWREVLSANPAVADVGDDVEALLLRRRDIAQQSGQQSDQSGAQPGGEPGVPQDIPAGGPDRPDASSETGEAKATECFLVPIDACYELVGRVRMHWRGFQGGQEVWREIDGFFDRLRERSEVAGGG
jgi:hypothetical protein